MITLSGELDIAVIPELMAVIDRLTLVEHEPMAEVVIELSGVTFIDSGGLGALIVARALAHGNGVGLRLRSAPGCVQRLAAIAGLGWLLETTPAPTSAT